MPIFLLAASGAFGWCGTKWPGWWRGPRGPNPPPPDPWWLSALGLVVGVAVGLVATRVGIREADFTLTDVAATGLIAFAVSGMVTDIARNFAGGGAEARTSL
jgi:uncharacterized membrane protein